MVNAMNSTDEAHTEVIAIPRTLNPNRINFMRQSAQKPADSEQMLTLPNKPPMSKRNENLQSEVDFYQNPSLQQNVNQASFGSSTAFRQLTSGADCQTIMSSQNTMFQLTKDGYQQHNKS